MTRPSLLLVDDEPDILEMLALTFHDCDHAVALNAEEALQQLRARSFDVLITDVRMPGESGLSLIEHARGLHRGIRTVVITGHHDPVSPQERAGVDRWIYKPFWPQKLRETVFALSQAAPPS